jgi:quercetin dioxygenase-like cupin family protein
MKRDTVKVGQIGIRYLVEGAANRGLGVFEMTVPAGARVPPPHSHTNNEECVYVLEGVLRYTVDGVTRELGPGEWMSTPRGSVHSFQASGDVAARVLVMLAPDIGEQYFHDVGAVVNAGGPPDVPRLAGVMARYGLVPASATPARAVLHPTSDPASRA